jgi:polygalacturonase
VRALVACLTLTLLPAAEGHAATGPASTGTVVVARDSTIVHNVGTSTVTVRAGVTVRQVLGKLTASDRSRQTRGIVDVTGAPKASGVVAADDRLTVVAEDGSVGQYRVAIHDPTAPQRDGVYWNQPLYERIDRTVNASVPVFPNRRCDVTDYEHLVRQATERYAVGNEAGDPAVTSSPLVYETQQVRYYGDAINKAIEDSHERGGGIVVIPGAGVYHSGAINLRSGVNLRVETGAVVKFMRNRTNEYYPVVRTSYEGTDIHNFSPLIYALGQHDIAVSGGGTLDGQEDMWNWRPWKKGYWGEPWVDDRSLDASYGQQGVLNQMNWADVPIEQRVFTDDGRQPGTMRSAFRPSFIQPNHSTNVLIEDVRIRNTPFWTVHLLNSRNVLVRGLDIYSNKATGYEARGWNNDDGINPESSRNVVLENNHVSVSDDGTAIKAGRNRNGREHRAPSERIIIRDSVYQNDSANSAAVSVGSEMSGGVRDVFIHDNRFGGTGMAMALKFKTNAYRGGVVENIYLRDSVLENTTTSLVELNANYSETVPLPNADLFNPTIRDIFVDRVDTAPTVSPGKTSFSIPGAASRSPIENVHYRDSTFHTSSTLEAGFARTRNLRNLVVENVRYVDPDTGVVTRYDTTPLNLLDETTAAGVPLSEDRITTVPAATFTLEGKVDFPQFLGTVRVFVDRSTTPIPVTLREDGSFTSAPITLDDNQHWYRDRHYVAVNLYAGINVNTVVYQVRAAS